MYRRLVHALVLTACLLAATAAAAAASSPPSRIDLPDGFRPEGIAAGKGGQLYVGSIPTGAVWTFGAKTGVPEQLVPPHEGRAAIGLKVDDKLGRLFVAGGPTGKAFVYDSSTGADVADFQLAPAGAQTFVNDVALTRRAAYFTDSRRSVLYVVDRDLSEARELPVPDIPLEEGNNLNGIVATRHGDTLLAVQTNAGRLWKIDAETGEAVQVDLGGASLVNGDGMLLIGRRILLVAQNRLNRIAVVRLDHDLDSGRVLFAITSDDFDVPTTIARVGFRLYVVNARFTTPATPETDYWVTVLGP